MKSGPNSHEGQSDIWDICGLPARHYLDRIPTYISWVTLLSVRQINRINFESNNYLNRVRHILQNQTKLAVEIV